MPGLMKALTPADREAIAKYLAGLSPTAASASNIGKTMAKKKRKKATAKAATEHKSFGEEKPRQKKCQENSRKENRRREEKSPQARGLGKTEACRHEIRQETCRGGRQRNQPPHRASSAAGNLSHKIAGAVSRGRRRIHRRRAIASQIRTRHFERAGIKPGSAHQKRSTTTITTMAFSAFTSADAASRSGTHISQSHGAEPLCAVILRLKFQRSGCFDGCTRHYRQSPALAGRSGLSSSSIRSAG